jgi:hypothetical protein
MAKGSRSMICKRLFAVTAIMVIALSTLMPADASTKKRTKHPAEPATLSLDGRNTGRARTCGFDTFLYDEYGATVGPYCH